MKFLRLINTVPAALSRMDRGQIPSAFVTFFLLSFGWAAYGQSLVSKPIIGAFDAHSAKVWFMVEDAQTVAVEVAGRTYQVTIQDARNWKERIPVTIKVEGLEPGQRTQAQVLIDGKPVGETFEIPSAPSQVQESWSFMVGSCSFYGVGATRLVTPGTFTDIYDVMRAQPTDFMLWLGDNVYLLNGEWNSDQRMYVERTTGNQS